MSDFNSGYDGIRKLIENGIDSGDTKSSRIGVIDGCGYRGIRGADSADTLLMHVADQIMDIHGLNQLSGETWRLARAIIRGMIAHFNATESAEISVAMNGVEDFFVVTVPACAIEEEIVEEIEAQNRRVGGQDATVAFSSRNAVRVYRKGIEIEGLRSDEGSDLLDDAA
ncbi:hypothetical protein ACFSQT_14280 [Mesorhizobium calcicola]|uniref:Uncharacterized protein n=1 Tax=Mesorhizobium calcicola TaxID=1300310 RepID=A0ABW4WCS1_9HYPH